MRSALPFLVGAHGRPVFDAARAVERQAGLAAYQTGSTAPTSLPSESDFSRSGTSPLAAYFLAEATLVTGSAAQVLRDIREELGVTGGERIYSVGLLERAAVRAAEFNAAFPAEQRALVPPIPAVTAGVTVVPVAWMRILLWVTYCADMRVDFLRLPTHWVMPVFGDVYPSTTGYVTAFRDFNERDLRLNPFQYVAPGTTVVASGDGSSDGIGGGGIVLGLLALAAIAASGSSK